MNDVNLACFLSLARTLNFSLTARNLSMPQQSVSRNIQALEDELGYPLLIRDSQNVSLTDAGKQFYDWAQSLDRRMTSVNMKLVRNTTSLGIGWGDWTGCPERLEKAIKLFEQRHPMIGLHVTQGSHEEIMHFLQDGIIDLALLPSRCIPFTPELIIEDSGCSLPLYICMCADNPLFKLGSSGKDLLTALPQLVPPLNSVCGHQESVSSLFSCPLNAENLHQEPTVQSLYMDLLYSSGYSILPINQWLRDHPDIVPWSDAGADAALSFIWYQNVSNPWVRVLIQLFKEETQ